MAPTSGTTRGRPNAVRRLLGRLLGEPAPGQASALPAPPRTLPAWFVGNRVHGTTRLRFGKTWDRPPPDEKQFAAEAFKKLGARVLMRHVKSSDEDPPWPTALPKRKSDGRPLSDGPRVINDVTVPPGRDVAKEIISDAKEHDMRIVVYYWHMSEASISRPHDDVEPHEDWVCKSAENVPIEHVPRGTYLDITGPYREVVLRRLLELADRGADGFNFDERHLPPAGCWDSSLEAAWKAEKGVSAPEPDEQNDLYLEFLDFKARKIEDTFLYWRRRVQAKHPNVVFNVSTTSIPALTSREMTTRLVRIADSAKNEYRLALSRELSKHVFREPGTPDEEDPDKLDPPSNHVRQALGWTVLRDAADGRPPRIWAPGLADDKHAQGFAASLLTFGCIANMDVDEPALDGGVPEEGKTPIAGLTAAFALGDRVSPHLADVLPLRWAAVHFSERIRNKRKANYAAAWREVLWPLVGGYQVLCEDGLPVGVVNDEQLDRGSLGGYRLLYLANPAELTNVQRQWVDRFKAAGGAVLENRPDWAWSDPALRPAAAAAFRTELASSRDTAPLVVRGGPRTRYGVAYSRPNKLVVAVTNDFDWVHVTRPPKKNDPDGDAGEDDNAEDPPAVARRPPPPATGVRVIWRRGHGLPQSFFPTRFHRLQAFEAVGRRKLPVIAFSGGYRVDLPPFCFMALLVVTSTPGPFQVPRQGRATAARSG
jgi:hypothetical protein